MQLTYRGARYTISNQSIEIIDTDLTGSFLGVRYRIKSTKIERSQRQKQPLSYRMVKYFA